MAKKKKLKVRELFNPKNLQREIDNYGYSFSIEKYIVFIVAATVLAVGFSFMYSLRWPYCLAILVVLLAVMPGIILDGYKNMYEHKRFLDVSDYMEQILYSFKANHKILSALEDTQTFFKGKMKASIQSAIAYIRTGKANENLYQEAFEKIEKEYPTRNLKGIHNYLQAVETNGGEDGESIRLLLEEKNIWANYILVNQEEKKAERTKVFVSILLTILLSVLFHSIYRNMPEQYNIIPNIAVQISTTILLILDILIFRKANGEISKSWIDRDKSIEEVKLVQYYQNILAYEEKKERKKSLIWAAPLFIATVPLLVVGKTYWVIGSTVIGIIMLNQHKLGYRVMYEQVVKEINMTFPKWLMQLALLLQVNNVYVSLEKSKEDAPAILKLELEKMLDDLKEKPNAQWPYENFLQIFNLSTVQSTMKTLYAISSMGNGEVQTQIIALVERNNKLLEKAEEMQNVKSLAGLTGIFYLPQITVIGQLLVTLSVFMISFLNGMKI